MMSMMLARSRCVATSTPIFLSNSRCIPCFANPFQQIQRNASTLMSDPQRPKPPVSPWIRFVGDFRKQHQEVKGKEVLKIASVEWKKMSEKQKSTWEKPYLIEKKTYTDEIKAYVDSGKSDQWKNKTEFLKRDPEKPKKPMTPWLNFIAEFRVKNPGLKVTEVTQSASKEWKIMTVEKTAPYKKSYEKAKAKYAKELQAYKASGKEQVWKNKVAEIKQSQQSNKGKKVIKSKEAK